MRKVENLRSKRVEVSRRKEIGGRKEVRRENGRELEKDGTEEKRR